MGAYIKDYSQVISHQLPSPVHSAIPIVDRKRFKKTQAIKITTKPTTTAVTVPLALIKIPKETISNWERINNTPPMVNIKTDTIGTKQVIINLKILSKRAKS